jgi:hypothetical protein
MIEGMRSPLGAHCALVIALALLGGRAAEATRNQDDPAINDRNVRALNAQKGGDYYFGSDQRKDKPKTKGIETLIKSSFPSPTSKPSLHAPGTSSPAKAKESPPPATTKRQAVPKKINTNLKKKQRSTKGDKEIGSKKSNMKGSSKAGMGAIKDGGSSSKGDGGGGGGGGIGSCTSSTAHAILDAVPDATATNPVTCCSQGGPTAVYVTHALPDAATDSGFEVFWDEMYREVDQTSRMDGVCFVMTGISPDSNRTLTEILIDVTTYVSQLPDVPSMMVTDPTDATSLLNTIRTISNDMGAALIGIFNAGYNNIIIESIVSAMGRLPFVGYLDDADYGTEAAKTSTALLNGVEAKPLCFNARLNTEMTLIGERCSAYYDEISNAPVDPPTGVACSSTSTSSDLFGLISNADANVVFADTPCCAAATDAVLMGRRMGKTIVLGCMDEGPSGVDFVTTQSVALQAYTAASWASFPVIEAQMRREGRSRQYFPSLQSLVNTPIYNEMKL